MNVCSERSERNTWRMSVCSEGHDEGGLEESSVVLNEVRKDVVKYVARRVEIIREERELNKRKKRSYESNFIGNSIFAQHQQYKLFAQLLFSQWSTLISIRFFSSTVKLYCSAVHIGQHHIKHIISGKLFAQPTITSNYQHNRLKKIERRANMKAKLSEAKWRPEYLTWAVYLFVLQLFIQHFSSKLVPPLLSSR